MTREAVLHGVAAAKGRHAGSVDTRSRTPGATLAPLETFRREFALPIERYGNDGAAARLRRIVSPFILRRLKSDPTVIVDRPPKNEMKVVCTLAREHATLYKAVVDEELRRIEVSDGIARRWRVLALLSFTKQICNHPAQYWARAARSPSARASSRA